jgi:hypothetical protein
MHAHVAATIARIFRIRFAFVRAAAHACSA